MSTIKFNVSRKQTVFSLGIPDSIDIGFQVAIREVGGKPYTGLYTVVPNFEIQELDTKDKLLRDNITVDPIEVSRVSNPAGGKTIYIGGITNG